MTDYIFINDVFDANGKKTGEVGIYREHFDKAKSEILADPDKSGYSKDLIDKLTIAGFITPAEQAAAKSKASK